MPGRFVTRDEAARNRALMSELIACVLYVILAAAVVASLRPRAGSPLTKAYQDLTYTYKDRTVG